MNGNGDIYKTNVENRCKQKNNFLQIVRLPGCLMMQAQSNDDVESPKLVVNAPNAFFLIRSLCPPFPFD